uniref:Uncharacterized protein n=1 Tax=Mus musculus TaxID=10090 RepID=Q9D2S0_MOUSE|nr:unnamed protein product [Mus musculus]
MQTCRRAASTAQVGRYSLAPVLTKARDDPDPLRHAMERKHEIQERESTASRSLWDLCWPFGRFSVLGLQREALPWGRSESRPEERPAGDKDYRHAFAFASLQIPEHSDFPRFPEATDLIGGSRKLLSFGNGALA